MDFSVQKAFFQAMADGLRVPDASMHLGEHSLSLKETAPHRIEEFNGILPFSLPIKVELEEVGAETVVKECSGSNFTHSRPGPFASHHSQPKKKSFKLKSGHYMCQLCGKVLSYKKSLRDHVRFVHENERSYQCDQCPYAAAKRRDLDKHVDSVHDKSKPFKSEAAILRHHRKQAVAQEDAYRPFRCDQCPFSTIRRGNLTNHILTVHECIRPFTCTQCDFSTSRDDLLTKHVRTVHERVESFGCELCPYETTDRTLLSTHVSHDHASLLKQFMTMRDRRVQCEMCSFECGSDDELKNHVRITHYKEQNGGFDCRLKSHGKCFHDKLLEFKCERCSFQTNARNKLESHMNSIHVNSC